MSAPLASFDPTTGARLGAVRTTPPPEVARVVEEVAAVQPFWAQLSPRARGGYLRRIAQVILDETDAICDLLVAEQGRPRAEAQLMEVLASVDTLHWLAADAPVALAARRLRAPLLPMRTKRASATFEPLGVIGAIAAADAPWSVPVAQVATALAAGNGVVLKPSSVTPLLGERLRDAVELAGVPEGLVRVVHGPGVGPALVDSPVAKVLFVGSSAAGAEVGAACGQALKGCVLALEGKDPMLVLDDADVEHAVAGALWGAFANAGQGGATIERAYVAHEAFDGFLAGLVAGARRLRVGDPRHARTEVGPLVCAARRDRAESVVRAAIEAGARRHCGGPVDIAGSPGAFYAPAVLTGVTPAMALAREPLPGPVLAVTPVASVDEALALANDSPFGLGASVWTADRPRGERVARELHAGMTWINEHRYSQGIGHLPWGGAERSGVGRLGAGFGLRECAQVTLRVWAPARARDPWWHPYDETLVRAMRHAATLLYGREDDRPAALRAGARPMVRLARRLSR